MPMTTLFIGALAALAQTGAALLDVSNVRCDPNLKTLVTPTFGNGSTWFPAAFTVCAEAEINSTISEAYDALLDFKSYGTWNTFVVNVEVPANVTTTPSQVYVGMPMTLTTKGLLPIINSTSNEMISVMDAPGTKQAGAAVAAWSTDYGFVGLKAEHPSVLRQLEDGTTLYVSWETYYGPLAYVVGGLLQKSLQEQFENQGEDLKAYLETNRNRA
ncbi:hypothetical protein GQ53DRAFT_746218 [Thozetella sp. PMI_491]|nr:hypothetical protein GQ53DRAFT_746218 [Thozetella sp. PMI_491]